MDAKLLLMDPKLKAKVSKAAELLYISTSAFIRMAISDAADKIIDEKGDEDENKRTD